MKIPSPDDEKTLLEEVAIDNYKIKVYWDADDVVLQASGFTMIFPEKRNSPIQVKKDSRPAKILLDNEDSTNKLYEIGERWRHAIHDRIRKDWGKKCFISDNNGDWCHPIFESKASHFTCLHCDKQYSGAELAENLWHCPSANCDGSPMHIRDLS